MRYWQTWTTNGIELDLDDLEALLKEGRAHPEAKLVPFIDSDGDEFLVLEG